MFACDRYRLFAWCVMPNHVHAIMQPHREWTLASILHSWKSFTAIKANRLLKRTGPFWQEEYYDHIVRRGEDFTRIIRYVLENPAKAGLRNWPWVGTEPWI
jgi:REP element-mobilizing transposase RayT